MTLGILAFAEGPISSLGKQDAVAVVTGQDIGSLTTGTVVASWNQTIAVSGNPLNIVQGTESVIADTIVSVSGENINSTVANVTLNIISNPIVQVSGQDIGSISLGPYGVTAGGQVSIDASSEPDLDIFTGNVSVVADANVSVTGQSIGTLTTGTATVDAVTLAPVLTNLLESNVSDVTVVATGEVVVTGQSIGTLTTGNVSVVANSTALPTGNIISTTLADVTLIQDSTPTVTGLTTAIGLSNSTAIYAWIEVDDAETSTWTEVDDSDTITWQDAA